MLIASDPLRTGRSKSIDSASYCMMIGENGPTRGGTTMKDGVLVAAALTMLFTGAAAAQETEIRFGFSSVADLENDNGATAWLFEKHVEDRRDDLAVQIYGSSEIGSDQDVIQAMQLGSGATMHIGGTALFNTFIPRVGVLDLPFLWQDYDHVGRALDGEVGEALEADFEQAGFKVLGWGYSWGYRNVVTSGVEVNEPGDIAGLKLRTIQSPIYVAALNAMGANATPMAFGGSTPRCRRGFSMVSSMLRPWCIHPNSTK
jgi:TRAP-type transport system periplasmic protein